MKEKLQIFKTFLLYGIGFIVFFIPIPVAIIFDSAWWLLLFLISWLPAVVICMYASIINIMEDL